MIDKEKRILILGHKGMVGSAIYRKFESEGFKLLFGFDRKDGDLRNRSDVNSAFSKIKPDLVVLAAARVGGILANDTFRAEFIFDNLMMEANITDASHKYGVEKYLFLGSSCIYPKFAPQPMKEELLLTGSLEFTNEPYAIAKIAGIKLCENYYRQYGSDFISVMPTNLYGPHDNFDLKTSHVLPALIRKFHEAKVNHSKKVEIWGTGNPKREFLYVEDLADAVYFLLGKVSAKQLYGKGISHINIGTGEDLSIAELASLIAEITEYAGKIEFDTSKPDGTPRKLLDVSRLNDMGWKYKTSLKEGIEKTYKWYLNNKRS